MVAQLQLNRTPMDVVDFNLEAEEGARCLAHDIS